MVKKNQFRLCLMSSKNKKYTLFFVYFICTVTTVCSQIAGKVYRDIDGNGKLTQSEITEPGVPGVHVEIFFGGYRYSTVTDGTGNYTFTSLYAPKDSLIRIEFSNFPSTFSAGIVGLQSGTNVQFIKAPVTGVDLGIMNDDEFCQPPGETMMVTACYSMGDPLKGGSAASDPSMVAFSYRAQGLAGVDDQSMVKLAKTKDIGSVWVAAYQRSSNLLLVGAITRRHVGLGPLGTGGFYTIDIQRKEVFPFIDVKTLGIDTGPDPHIDVKTGLNILPSDKLAHSRDSLAFQMAGKVGIGGTQLTQYQDGLFLVNLYDKKLYELKVGNPLNAATASMSGIKSHIIPHPNCSNNDYLPWALKYYRGKLFLGVVCTAETSQKKSDLKAAVYEFNPSQSQFKNIFEFDLNYSRGPIDNTQGCDTITTWYPWTNVFPKQCNYPLGAPDPDNAFAVYPQPILSDIEFDDDGSLLLAFMDRLGLQTGQNQPGIAINDTLHYYGFMSGDFLRAQLNSDGSYSLENNGISGSLTGCGSNTGAGPGGGEFFCEDIWLNGQGNPGHEEILNGAVMKLSGMSEVIVSAMDPLDHYYLSTGFVTYNTKTGTRNRSYALYSINPGTLGKSGGIGDLVGLCAPAPLEVGNRVWLDLNKDGIQQPEEKGIDGLILTLHDMEAPGVEISRDTTANGGQYYFNDFNTIGKLKRNHAYEIRMSLNQAAPKDLRDYGVPAGLIQDNVTISLFQAAGGVGSSIRDSDARLNQDNSQIVIVFTTGNNAENNHNLDFGLIIRECSPYCIPMSLRKFP